MPVSKLLLTAMLLAMCGAGYGQVNAGRVERSGRPKPGVQTPDDVQQRRAAVRAALQAQRDQNPADTQAAPREHRHLSLQERQALRQQLRQQRS